MTLSLAVVRAGMLTTVQDLGRWGYQANGVPVAGPMDAYSHGLANRLVGNLSSAAALEITLIGPELEAKAEIECAVAGATFALAAGDRTLPMHAPFTLRAGRSTEVRRAVSRGPSDARLQRWHRRAAPLWEPRDQPDQRHGRIRRAPTESRRCAADRAGHDARHTWSCRAVACPASVATRWRQAPCHGRSAGSGSSRRSPIERCSGRDMSSPPRRIAWAIVSKARGSSTPARADMLSDATPVGSIQVPASGQPILLMADRQTTGGYPKIAVVISADLPLAGQLAPGDWIEFVPCTREAAVDALKARRRGLGSPR